MPRRAVCLHVSCCFVTPPCIRCKPCGFVIKGTSTKLFDCKGNWSAAVNQVNKTDNIADPLERNKQITADYANLYKKTPDLQWAGLASVVSRNAGCGMVKAAGIADGSDIRHYVVPTASSKAQIAYNGLADTNQTIYRTVGPTMTFVSQHGAKQMQACTASKAIPIRGPLKNPVPNSKLDNTAMPPEMSTAVDKLASAEDMPPNSPERQAAGLQAANAIAEYEQKDVVQQRIYQGNQPLQDVMAQNQEFSQFGPGRMLGATPPTVALSADCGAIDRVPFRGSINNSTDRVQYYRTLMQQFGSHDQSSLINTLSKGPGF